MMAVAGNKLRLNRWATMHFGEQIRELRKDKAHIVYDLGLD